jgi:phenylacetate-CoA ligase
VGAQRQTLTYASISSVLDQAGFVKINLNPAEWRAAEDRVAFLEAMEPEIYSGDPIALEELARLALRVRPKALVSSSMTLLPALRDRLADRFSCPVLDVYSLTECRFLASMGPRGMQLTRPDVYIETIGRDGRPCEGRGELVVSGGNNPFLRLLRYRTGDFAALRHEVDGVYVEGLEGRAPVVFRADDGREVNNIDVTHVLRDIPLSRFSLHQSADGSFQFRGRGEVDGVREALAPLLGPRLRVERDDAMADGKLIQYSRDEAAP